MKRYVFLILAMVLILSFPINSLAKTYKLRYAHMSPDESFLGRQAKMFAKLVKEKTGGAVVIDLFPSSQLGTLQEQVEQVQTGITAFNHNTMAAIGTLFDPLSALDTPYLYKNVDHLMRVTDTATSPLMKELNAQLIKRRGVRILYTFYFGTRQLTCNRPIYKPEDLKGVKIRCIPFPVYKTAVEGLGAVATPLNWAEVVTALATGVVDGQENPVTVPLDHKLYELQKYLMLTSHIMGSEAVIVTEKSWQDFGPKIRAQVMEAAKETSAKATQTSLKRAENAKKELVKKGMKIIGPEQGLKLEAFLKRVKKIGCGAI